MAEVLALDSELLDDLKTAVSEACNNVVLHAYGDRIGPLAVLVYVEEEGITVIVRDQGFGISATRGSRSTGQGVGLAVIRALTVRSEFLAQSGGGTEIRMVFAAMREGHRLFEAPPACAVAAIDWPERLAGDAVVSVSPVVLLPGVLGRIARALAATARFSLDRFSDVYLVTDAIAEHAATAASEESIGFAIRAGLRRLEMTVGPFEAGTADQLRGGQATVRDVSSPLALLADELASHPMAGSEMLRAVLIDHPRWS